MNRFKNITNFDFILFVAMTLLIFLGILFIYSSGINSEGIQVSNEYIKQIIFASTGLVLIFLAILIDYRKIKRVIPYVYSFFILVLLYTTFFGRYVNGARSWIGIGTLGIQPSEFGKIVYILFFAWFLEKTENSRESKRFILSLLFLLLPMGIILLQPDLGTASVYIPIFLVMCYLARIRLRYILFILIFGLLTIVLTILPVWQDVIYQKELPILAILTVNKLRFVIILAMGSITIIALIGTILFQNKYYFWIVYIFGLITCALIASKVLGFVLKDYQIKRLIVFLDPQTDPLGAGWNIIQSKIAIGSGSIWGQGYLEGTQSHYRFLPQQSTDFIFSILSEEFGFVGSIFVFILFFIILFRILKIMKEATNSFGYYISGGILIMFFFHFIINVGMVMGIMPITGIPLMFLSYGGSSLWTAMLSIGIVLGIKLRRLEF